MNLKSNTINIDGKLYEQNNITGDLTPLTELRKATKGAGRPPARTRNKHYEVIQALVKLQNMRAKSVTEANRNIYEAKQDWFDDYVCGACLTSGKTSNGRMNASKRDVIKLLCLPEFGSKDAGCSMYTFETDERRQQLVAQVARFALGGINHYLYRIPSLLEALENLVLEWQNDGSWWNVLD